MARPSGQAAYTASGPAPVNIFDLMELARARENVISMGLGDPDLDSPAHVVEAAKQAIVDTRTGPAPTRGLPELRQAIARKVARDSGIEYDPESEILVTNGGQEALFLLVQALINPGDEVVVPDPRYTSYDAAIRLAGGNMILVPTREADDFDLDPREVEKRLTPNTKVMLLITPNNPTAGIISPDNIRRLAEIAVERDLIVVFDEIYEKFVHEDAEHLSIATLPGMRERTITVNGVSKTYAMTGWRIGFLTAPAEFVRTVTALKDMVNVQAPTVSQWAAVAALDGPQDCVEEMRAIYAERRQLVMDALDEMGFTYGRPKGGLYVWVNTTSTGINSTDLSYLFLKEGNVLIFPGTGFGDHWSGYMRMTLLQPKEILEQAIEGMKTTLEIHRARPV